MIQTDWTHASELGITIAGAPYDRWVTELGEHRGERDYLHLLKLAAFVVNSVSVVSCNGCRVVALAPSEPLRAACGRLSRSARIDSALRSSGLRWMTAIGID